MDPARSDPDSQGNGIEMPTTTHDGRDSNPVANDSHPAQSTLPCQNCATHPCICFGQAISDQMLVRPVREMMGPYGVNHDGTETQNAHVLGPLPLTPQQAYPIKYAEIASEPFQLGPQFGNMRPMGTNPPPSYNHTCPRHGALDPTFTSTSFPFSPFQFVGGNMNAPGLVGAQHGSLAQQQSFPFPYGPTPAEYHWPQYGHPGPHQPGSRFLHPLNFDQNLQARQHFGVGYGNNGLPGYLGPTQPVIHYIYSPAFGLIPQKSQHTVFGYGNNGLSGQLDGTQPGFHPMHSPALCPIPQELQHFSPGDVHNRLPGQLDAAPVFQQHGSVQSGIGTAGYGDIRPEHLSGNSATAPIQNTHAVVPPTSYSQPIDSVLLQQSAGIKRKATSDHGSADKKQRSAESSGPRRGSAETPSHLTRPLGHQHGVVQTPSLLTRLLDPQTARIGYETAHRDGRLISVKHNAARTNETAVLQAILQATGPIAIVVHWRRALPGGGRNKYVDVQVTSNFTRDRTIRSINGFRIPGTDQDLQAAEIIPEGAVDTSIDYSRSTAYNATPVDGHGGLSNTNVAKEQENTSLHT
ncbi:hypothetical protein F5Y18DRAFT_424269 [Xylariaceae sp. FL1019]|nr:hypothetical protein F5Y18DRAFT_424269 [Xylariaceae sp. FL1019]